MISKILSLTSFLMMGVACSPGGLDRSSHLKGESNSNINLPLSTDPELKFYIDKGVRHYVALFPQSAGTSEVISKFSPGKTPKERKIAIEIQCDTGQNGSSQNLDPIKQLLNLGTASAIDELNDKMDLRDLIENYFYGKMPALNCDKSIQVIPLENDLYQGPKEYFLRVDKPEDWQSIGPVYLRIPYSCQKIGASLRFSEREQMAENGLPDHAKNPTDEGLLEINLGCARSSQSVKGQWSLFRLDREVNAKEEGYLSSTLLIAYYKKSQQELWFPIYSVKVREGDGFESISGDLFVDDPVPMQKLLKAFSLPSDTSIISEIAYSGTSLEQKFNSYIEKPLLELCLETGCEGAGVSHYRFDAKDNLWQKTPNERRQQTISDGRSIGAWSYAPASTLYFESCNSSGFDQLLGLRNSDDSNAVLSADDLQIIAQQRNKRSEVPCLREELVCTLDYFVGAQKFDRFLANAEMQCKERSTKLHVNVEGTAHILSPVDLNSGWMKNITDIRIAGRNGNDVSAAKANLECETGCLKFTGKRLELINLTLTPKQKGRTVNNIAISAGKNAVLYMKHVDILAPADRNVFDQGISLSQAQLFAEETSIQALGTAVDNFSSTAVFFTPSSARKDLALTLPELNEGKIYNRPDLPFLPDNAKNFNVIRQRGPKTVVYLENMSLSAPTVISSSSDHQGQLKGQFITLNNATNRFKQDSMAFHLQGESKIDFQKVKIEGLDRLLLVDDSGRRRQDLNFLFQHSLDCQLTKAKQIPPTSGLLTAAMTGSSLPVDKLGVVFRIEDEFNPSNCFEGGRPKT